MVISGFQALRQARMASDGARTRNRRVPADLREDSLSTVIRRPQGDRTGQKNLKESFFIHNKVISGFEALRQARAPVARLEPATEGSLQ
ncbi:hypothetical protein PoB_005896700 [Plakobranchus ocellatus]|uniref:Uncharacterized protein n=1 Tax=Plakobranchus ocellatus TaxID=259542 RepID=A0AAV4CLP8_9GAST|nr:hypothetical protein PoB_005896700 [Plakobranchus ocellatus]